MSTSRCFRCALEVSRSSRRIPATARPSPQRRQYASETDLPSIQPAGTKKITVSASDPPPNRNETRKQAATNTSNPTSPSALSSTELASKSEELAEDVEDLKPFPPNVVAAFRTPYRHPQTHGIPVANVQLRSYSVRNLEFFADFALRIAYYLKLPASGSVPLPKKIERWTMTKSPFIFKKKKETFERITLKRLITVYDGHPDVVEVWLAALRKWQFYGVGMKANVWQFEGLDVAGKMDKQMAEVEKELDEKLAQFGWNKDVAGKKSIEEMLRRQGNNKAGVIGAELRDDIKDAKYIDLFRDIK